MATITIKNLIGGSINIVTGGGGTSERWVKPQYTDDWAFSDGKERQITIVEFETQYGKYHWKTIRED